jgi:hypothetical protein
MCHPLPEANKEQSTTPLRDVEVLGIKHKRIGEDEARRLELRFELGEQCLVRLREKASDILEHEETKLVPIPIRGGLENR